MSITREIAPEVVQFGPCRTIGLSYVAGNGSVDFPSQWDRLVRRMPEIRTPMSPKYFGFCRCIPGKTDGTWEYIAAVEADAASAVPEGMVEVMVPACDYASLAVEGFANIGPAWKAIQAAAGQMPGYAARCGAHGCECATHPSFEYYPPTFPASKRLFVCVPLKRTR